MTKTIHRLIPVLILAVALQGCSMFRYLDGSSDEEVKNFLSDAYTVKLEDPAKKQAEIDQQVAIAKELEAAKAAIEIQRARDEAAQAAKAKEEIARKLAAESEARAKAEAMATQAIRTTVAPVAAASPVVESPKAEKEKLDKASVRIKVLSGNGKIVSATKLTKDIAKLGYRVERVDTAPKKTFSRLTIFYKPGFKDTATSMAEELGGGIIKQVSWETIFDIIAVTGKE